MKGLIILLSLFISCMTFSQTWTFELNPLQYDTPNFFKEIKKGIRSEKVIELNKTGDTTSSDFFLYDTLGNMVLQKIFNADTVYYQYDSKNLVSQSYSKSDGATEWSFNFDANGRIIKRKRLNLKTNWQDSVILNYDINDDLVKVIYNPDYFVECTYFKDHKIKSKKKTRIDYDTEVVEYRYNGDTIFNKLYVFSGKEKGNPYMTNWLIKSDKLSEMHNFSLLNGKVEFIHKKYFNSNGQIYFETMDTFDAKKKKVSGNERKFTFNEYHNIILCEWIYNEKVDTKQIYIYEYY